MNLNGSMKVEDDFSDVVPLPAFPEIVEITASFVCLFFSFQNLYDYDQSLKYTIFADNK